MNIEKAKKKIKSNYDLLIEAASNTGVHPAWIAGMALVETSFSPGARAFNNNHLLARAKEFGEEDKIPELKKQKLHIGPHQSGKKTYSDHRAKYRNFEKAFKIAPKAAIASTAWGTFQVMGRHLLKIYPDPQQAWEAYQSDPARVSMELLTRFVKAVGKRLVIPANKAVKTGDMKYYLKTTDIYYGRPVRSYATKVKTGAEAFKQLYPNHGVVHADPPAPAGIENPKLLKLARPVPEPTVKARLGVSVLVTLDAEGKVIGTKLDPDRPNSKRVTKEFVQVVMDALRRSEFAPAKKNGVPIAVTFSYTYVFVPKSFEKYKERILFIGDSSTAYQEATLIKKFETSDRAVRVLYRNGASSRWWYETLFMAKQADLQGKSKKDKKKLQEQKSMAETIAAYNPTSIRIVTLGGNDVCRALDPEVFSDYVSRYVIKLANKVDEWGGPPPVGPAATINCHGKEYNYQKYRQVVNKTYKWVLSRVGKKYYDAMGSGVYGKVKGNTHYHKRKVYKDAAQRRNLEEIKRLILSIQSEILNN